jgi:hypothetical protein
LKKVLTKTISIAMIACLLLACVPMLASAADVSNADVIVSGDTATISGTAGAAGEEIAIVIIECTHEYTGDEYCPDCYIDDYDTANVVYVNQTTATGDNGSFSFAAKLPEGIYTAFIGGTNVDEQKILSFEISKGGEGEIIKYGDLDRNGFIQANDIGVLASYLVGALSFDRQQLLASDLDKNEYIQANDIGVLAIALTGTDPDLGLVDEGAVVRDTQGDVIAQRY